MVAWLSERGRAGDSIAQHGFQHVRPRRDGAMRRLLCHAPGRRMGEFSGLDGEETRRAVHAGWRLLKLAGIEPDGFVAPDYAYTPALRGALGLRFRWWAGLLRVHRSDARLEPNVRGPISPAWSFATDGPFARALSPPLLRIGSLLPTSTLRVDLHPADLRNPRHMLALEWVLQRNGSQRRAITYRELAESATACAQGSVPPAASCDAER
jgi:hypothetical protein